MLLSRKGSLCLKEHPGVILTTCHYPRLSATSSVCISVYSVGFSRSQSILLNAIYCHLYWNAVIWKRCECCQAYSIYFTHENTCPSSEKCVSSSDWRSARWVQKELCKDIEAATVCKMMATWLTEVAELMLASLVVILLAYKIPLAVGMGIEKWFYLRTSSKLSDALELYTLSLSIPLINAGMFGQQLNIAKQSVSQLLNLQQEGLILERRNWSKA